MLNLRTVARFSISAVLILGLSTSCHTPLASTEAGSLVTERIDRDVSVREGFFTQILLYIPNRLVDAIDMVHFGVGVAIPVGVDVRITKWGQLALQAGVGVGIGYDDRSHSPAWASASATAAFGPFRTGAGTGSAPSVGDWEIGVGLPGMKIAIDLAEIVDFVLGFLFIDILEDDYGWS
ncbi:MAG: hypothetical protein ACI8TQ_002818 [Planctomycetota bacterium]|jgi:hypothetical protein